MSQNGEQLRRVMRQWASGVAVVTSSHNEVMHGMTVNSFNSISLSPPLVTVTMTNNTRTKKLVSQSGIFSVTILEENQREISDIFSGKRSEMEDRFIGLEIFTLSTGCPLIKNGIAFLDCQVVHQYPMPDSTLFVGEVLDSQTDPERWPLLYLKRSYFKVQR